MKLAMLRHLFIIKILQAKSTKKFLNAEVNSNIVGKKI
jgi:hypothetical protein